ncbi:MAG: ABC-2 transporter permease, partial [Anaerolineales bacterium]|nr:ABC-2 transporter permease [Anaerolineales bacterium]
MKRQVLAITRKELNSYFGSPLAIIFLGTFLAAVLFIFFTVETFFARGVADIRPLFRWMPILLIFLLAALTMRQWSEEQRSGTQELLLTLPVSPLNLVLGKFLAVMGLISLALALTLPLPITVGLLGNLDWGPVLGGYLAALLMAAAYA